jgi:hypothetical protein
MAFFGYKITYIRSGFGLFLVVTDDGAVFIASSENSTFSPIQFPFFFTSDVLCAAELGSGRLFLVTASGKLYVCLTCRLFSPTPVRKLLSRVSKADWLFTAVTSTADTVYFLVNGHRQPVLSSSINHRSLVGRSAPVMIDLHSGFFPVFPDGAKDYGFFSGDIVSYQNETFAVIGSSKTALVLMNCATQHFVELEPARKFDLMFELALIGREGGELAEVVLKDGRRLTIDFSPAAMSSMSSFKPDDVIMNPLFGRGLVLGVRAEALVVKYESGIRLSRFKTPEELMLSHVLLERDGTLVLQMPTVDRGWVLVEQVASGKFAPGCIVASDEFGVGQFLGCLGDGLVVNFLRDARLGRVLAKGENIRMVRAKQSCLMGFLALNRSSVIVDVNEALCDSLGFFPGDFVRMGKRCALCVGGGLVGSELGMFVETDEMLLCGLGVGVFQAGRLREGELLARIAGAGKRQMKLETGETIDLSVNTSDFLSCPVMPLDRIAVGSRLAIVTGMRAGEVFVQYDGGDYVSKLPEKYELVMRRFGIPTRRMMEIESGERKYGEMVMEMDAYRGMWFCPGDIVRQENRRMRVIGMLEKRVFLVASMETGEQMVANLNPGGIMEAVLEHRPFFD